jgi:hypothetical protein
MDLKNQALRYFYKFSNKDLQALKTMFDASVILKDWKVDAVGLPEVLHANQDIFDSIESIKVTPLALYEQGRTVVAELDILVNNFEHIAVVDIIGFNDKGLITSIRAYKG